MKLDRNVCFETKLLKQAPARARLCWNSNTTKEQRRGKMKDFRMNKKEADQIIIFDSIIKGQISQKEAAIILKLGPRQVRRKLKRYLMQGAEGLVHRSRGKPSNRRLSEEIRVKIVELLTTIYPNLGPTLAAEKLAENHQIYIDHETLRRLMIEESLWQMHQRKFISHVWRERKLCLGELVQVDGSYHQWFNNQYTTLIAFIDDATGMVELLFADHETTESLVNISKSYLNKYGRPRALYADCGRVYKINNAKDVRDRDTQFGRMLKELDIEIIHAYSPQAKGRVERLFKTLQDRLVKELKLRKIETIEDANGFLKEVYIDIFNQKFSKPARSTVNLHRSIEGYDLNAIFCIKEVRILNNDRTISYKNRLFFLRKDQPVQLYKKCKITVCVHLDGTISLRFSGKKLDYKEIVDKPHREKKRPEKIIRNNLFRPPQNHPWRNPGEMDTLKESKRGHS